MDKGEKWSGHKVVVSYILMTDRIGMNMNNIIIQFNYESSCDYDYIQKLIRQIGRVFIKFLRVLLKAADGRHQTVNSHTDCTV